MKAVKIVLIVIGALIALLLLTGLFVKKDYRVERSIVINAPSGVVMDQVKSLKNQQQWSPWAELDTNMNVTFSGVDGQVGSYSEWHGNSDVGKGRQEVTAISPNRVETHLTFFEPMESESDAYVQLEEQGDKAVKATWGFTGNTPYPMNIMCLFMDAMMGKDFEKGLSKLKARCESIASSKKTYRGFEIHEMDMQPRTYIAKREEVGFDKIADFYGKNFPKIYELTGKAGLKPAGSPSGIFYKWDSEAKKASMAAAIPVENAGAKVKDYETITVPGGKTLFIDYYGAYEKSENAHYAMDEYMKEKNLTMNEVVVEEYITDPSTEKDTSKWLTRIYYPVK